MPQLIFFLEERSAKEMLTHLIPRLIPEDWEKSLFITFEGKTDLDKSICQKLKGWKRPNTKLIILRDKDSGDCKLIRQDLVQKCLVAEKPDTLVRIAIHELESWYLGDLAAVEKAFEIKGAGALQKKSKFRDPDKLANAAQELKNLTDQRYQKVKGSRVIGHHLSLTENQSTSYLKFISGIQRLISEEES
ncbi:MAG: DUF4276 family protein [SAR324 cluster bacterium]|nr:DUF4276 family protein [SAR324 cluster bacterium]